MSSPARKRALRREARPEVVIVDDVTWLFHRGPAMEYTVKRGQEALQRVNTDIFCYRMTCGCGRMRYARLNDLHQIGLCRVCQHGQRVNKKREERVRLRRLHASPCDTGLRQRG
jgi:hypothetical protein